MPRTKKKPIESSAMDTSPMRSAPAITPEAREQQLISLAVNLAEKQLRDGTASSQVITHYLRLGTERERYELERLRADVELSRAKRDSYESSKLKEEMYAKAIAAMKDYAMPNEEWEGEY